MIWGRHRKRSSKLGIAALALGALATAGNGQTEYKGKFTPFEAHWGGTTLSAGDYTFTMASASSSYALYIHGQARNALILAAAADKSVASSHAQLSLVDIADAQNVQTFDAPEIGLTLSYLTPKQNHTGHREARHKAMSQTAPASQASENATSIQVYSAGR